MTPQQTSSSIRDYLHALRRRWKPALAVVLAAVGVAAALSYTTEPVYEATAQLTYVRQADITSLVNGTPAYSVSALEAQVQAQTYAELMSTAEMKERAETTLGRDLAPDVEVTSAYLPDTSVLRISTRSGDAAEALTAANAYADGFEAWRRAAIKDQYSRAQGIIRGQIAEYGSDPERFSDPKYVQLEQRLQDIGILKEAATGNFIVAAHAELPTEPVLPRHVRDLMIGLLVGIVLAIGVVTLLEQLDIRLHSVDEIGEAVALPVLGRMPHWRGRASEPGLAAMLDPSGPSAEAIRMLRGNLEFADVDNEIKAIMFSSATQAEGKTTTLCNLALVLARTGKRVMIVDCDLRRPRVHAYLGLSNRHGISTVVSGRATLEEALQRIVLGVPGESDGRTATVTLDVLVGGPAPPNPGEIVAARRFGELLTVLKSRCDLLLIDTPPFLVVGDTAALAHSADGIIVVSRLGTVTKSMAKEIWQFLQPLPCRPLGLVVTNVPVESGSYRYKYRSDSGEAEPSSEPDSETTGRIPQPLSRA